VHQKFREQGSGNREQQARRLDLSFEVDMREADPGTRTGSELERRYPVALALYVMLGVLAWFTMGADTVVVFGRPVELRVIPILILGTFAFRTVVALKADRIRRK
jgi:hypothetical protein